VSRYSANDQADIGKRQILMGHSNPKRVELKTNLFLAKKPINQEKTFFDFWLKQISTM